MSLQSEIRFLKKQLHQRPWLFARLADLYMRTGQNREARKILQEGLSRYPNYSSARLQIARLHLAEGRRMQGQFELQRCCEDVDGICAAWVERLVDMPADHEEYHQLLQRVHALDTFSPQRIRMLKDHNLVSRHAYEQALILTASERAAREVRYERLIRKFLEDKTSPRSPSAVSQPGDREDLLTLPEPESGNLVELHGQQSGANSAVPLTFVPDGDASPVEPTEEVLAEAEGDTPVAVEPEEPLVEAEGDTPVAVEPEEPQAEAEGNTPVAVEPEEPLAEAEGDTPVAAEPEEPLTEADGDTPVAAEPEEPLAETEGDTPVAAEPEEPLAETEGDTPVAAEPEEPLAEAEGDTPVAAEPEEPLAETEGDTPVAAEPEEAASSREDSSEDEIRTAALAGAELASRMAGSVERDGSDAELQEEAAELPEKEQSSQASDEESASAPDVEELARLADLHREAQRLENLSQNAPEPPPRDSESGLSHLEALTANLSPNVRTRTLARIYEEQGYFQLALEVYEFLARNNPEDKQLADNLQRLQKLMEDGPPMP